MKVAAVHIRPDMTQIVEGTIKKNTLYVRHLSSMYSIYPALQSFQKEALEEGLIDVKKQLHDKNAAIYFGIPDDIVKKIDCDSRDYVSLSQWNEVVPPWIHQLLQVDPKEYHVITPLHFENNNKSIITGIAIRSTYIDAIFNAAIAAKLNIASIEPSSFAMLRLINQWDKEHCIMEVWERVTSMTGYSPIRGMFQIRSSQGWSTYLAENGNKELLQSISSHDFSAYNTYGLANTNIPIYLNSDKSGEIGSLILDSSFSHRLKLPSIPEDFLQSKFPTEELLDYVVPLGLALTPLHERMSGNADT